MGNKEKTIPINQKLFLLNWKYSMYHMATLYYETIGFKIGEQNSKSEFYFIQS